MSKLWSEVDRFLFPHGSLTTLGVYRILYGLLCMANFFLLGVQWHDWFTERGYHPSWMSPTYFGPLPELFGTEPSRVNLFSLSGAEAWSYFLFAVGAVCAVLLTVGKWTKPVSIVLAIILVSMHHRSPMILHGGDTVIRIMALYLALSPCGMACSLDRLAAIRAGTVSPKPAQGPLWTQRLITYNVSLVYFTTVWLKFGGSLWRDGSATYFPNRLQEFERFPVPAFIKEMPFVMVTTYGTLLTEFALVSLVYYKPFRKYVLIAAVCMHLFIEYSMNIPLFAFLMITSYINFFDGEELENWAKQLSERWAKIRVVVPVSPSLSTGQMDALNAMNVLNLVEFRPAPEPPSAAEVRASAIRCPGAWAIAWMPGVWRSWLAGTSDRVRA
jgi:hypothetical protein